MVHQVSKDRFHLAAGIFIGVMHFGMTIELLVEMPSESGVAGFEICRVADETRGVMAYVVDGGDTRYKNGGPTGGDEILDLPVDEAAEDEFAMGTGP